MTITMDMKMRIRTTILIVPMCRIRKMIIIKNWQMRRQEDLSYQVEWHQESRYPDASDDTAYFSMNYPVFTGNGRKSWIESIAR